MREGQGVPIIPARSLARGTPVIAYFRVSEPTQVSNGSLARQQEDGLEDIRALALALKEVVSGCEYGKPSACRPHFLRAIEAARKHNAGIVTADLTRLLRAEAFDKEKNRLAVPTGEEIEGLLKTASGVPFLATIADPSLSPSELHSTATKRGMRQSGNPGGRPSSISFSQGKRILADRRQGDSYGKIASRYKLSKTAVIRFCQAEGGEIGPEAGE